MTDGFWNHRHHHQPPQQQQQPALLPHSGMLKRPRIEYDNYPDVKLSNGGGVIQASSSSMSDIVDGRDSGHFNDNGSGLRSTNAAMGANSNQVEAEWIEQYEPGVYITLVALLDGTRDLKRVRFSRRRFGEHQAESWWSENREKVYEKYNVHSADNYPDVKLPNGGGVIQASSSSMSDIVDGRDSGHFNDNDSGLRSTNAALGANSNQVEAEWIEQYEPGVYITLVALLDGTRDLKRVRFRFGEHQAESWWSENQEKVYEKYNVRSADKSSGQPSST